MPQFPATERKKDFPIRRAVTRAHFNSLRRESRRKVENPSDPLVESFRSTAGNGLVRGIVVVVRLSYLRLLLSPDFYFPAARLLPGDFYWPPRIRMLLFTICKYNFVELNGFCVYISCKYLREMVSPVIGSPPSPTPSMTNPRAHVPFARARNQFGCSYLKTSLALPFYVYCMNYGRESIFSYEGTAISGSRKPCFFLQFFFLYNQSVFTYSDIIDSQDATIGSIKRVAKYSTPSGSEKEITLKKKKINLRCLKI